MLNGVFRNPTTIFFGHGAEENLPLEISKFSKKILLIYGSESFKKTGLSEKILPLLKSSGIEFVELGGIKSNPSSEQVYKGIELCRSKKLTFVLAIGGGSAIDTAKAVGIGAQYDGDFLDFFRKKKAPEKSIPIGTVLTLPGTGSESSDASVIADESGKKLDCANPCMFPVFSVLNPEFSMTAPLHYRAAGVVDATSHVFERYFSNTDFVECSDYICEGLLKTLVKYGPLMIKDPQNYDYSAEVMWACKLAHDNTAGFGRKQDWSCHKISHELNSIYDIVHGASLGVIFSSWMKLVLETTNQKLFLQLAKRVFEVQTAEAAIESYRNFLIEMDMPLTLRELGLNSKEHFTKVAERCAASTPSGTIGNFKRLASHDIINILEQSF